MKIVVGKYYRTRDGRKALIYAHYFGNKRDTWHGTILEAEDQWEPFSWRECGRTYLDVTSHRTDLIEEWTEKQTLTFEAVCCADVGNLSDVIKLYRGAALINVDYQKAFDALPEAGSAPSRKAKVTIELLN